MGRKALLVIMRDSPASNEVKTDGASADRRKRQKTRKTMGVKAASKTEEKKLEEPIEMQPLS